MTKSTRTVRLLEGIDAPSTAPHHWRIDSNLKSDADQNLIAAIESLRQHKPFLTSTVTDFVLDDYLRRADTPGDGVAHDAVTLREREIIQLLAEGKSNKEAASTLGISGKTIEAQCANIMRKLRLRSVSELVRYAICNKIVQP